MILMAFQSVNLIAMGRQQVVREWVDGDGPVVGGGLCCSVGGPSCWCCLALARPRRPWRGHAATTSQSSQGLLTTWWWSRLLASILLLLAIWKSFTNLSRVAKLQMMKLAAVELEHFSESWRKLFGGGLSGLFQLLSRNFEKSCQVS